MRPRDSFEYGGLFLHASEQHSLKWRMKGDDLVPPVEDFHRQLILNCSSRSARQHDNNKDNCL